MWICVFSVLNVARLHIFVLDFVLDDDELITLVTYACYMFRF